MGDDFYATDEQVDAVRELLAVFTTDTLDARGGIIGQIVYGSEGFEHRDGISQRVDEVIEAADAEGSLDQRAREFVENHPELHKPHDPVEMSRVIARFADTAYALNDVGTKKLAVGVLYLWERTLGEDGVTIETDDEGETVYPREGLDLITELIEYSQGQLDKTSDPIQLAVAWNEYVTEQNASAPGGQFDVRALAEAMGIELDA